jgi:beta-glucosidase
MSLEELQENLVEFNANNFETDFLVGVSSVDYNLNNNSDSQFDNTIENFSNIDAIYKSELLLYKQDIALLKHTGIQNFRFSLSWSRILPTGTGESNQDAIAFYNEVLDICIENNVVPYVSIFDSHLPPSLEKKGGWSNREMLDWFENYVGICVNAFTNKVDHWIIYNEPSVFTKATQFLEINTSGKNNVNNFLSTLHHTLLCQSLGFKKIKKIAEESQVGTFFCCNYVIPLTFSEKDLKAVERTDALLNRIFIEPSQGLGYPIKTLPFLKSISKYCFPGDENLIKVDFDFIGLQNCTREIVKHNIFVPYLNAKVVEYDKLRVKKNHLGSEIYRELIYLIIRKYSFYERVKKIYINEPLTYYSTKNDEQLNNSEKKENGVHFFLEQIVLANQSGGKVKGYFMST